MTISIRLEIVKRKLVAASASPNTRHPIASPARMVTLASLIVELVSAI